MYFFVISPSETRNCQGFNLSNLSSFDQQPFAPDDPVALFLNENATAKIALRPDLLAKFCDQHSDERCDTLRNASVDKSGRKKYCPEMISWWTQVTKLL